MRGAVWDGEVLHVLTDPDDDDLQVAPPGPGEVTVRVVASGICHSDLNVLDGNSRVRPPVVLGHEAAGYVEATGEAVVVRADVSGADRRPFTWRGTPTRSYAGISSWAERITVPADRLVPTGGLDPIAACLVGCAASTGWGVVNNVAHVERGQTVAVLGVGGIGVNAIAAAHRNGAHVVAIDIDPTKEPVARAFGADDFRAALDAPVDVAIECSGAPPAIDAAVTHGRLVTALVGIPPAGYRVSLDPTRLFEGHRVLGSYGGATTIDDMATIISIADDLRLRDQVTRVWPLAELADAIAAVRAGHVVRAVLDLR